MKHAFTFLLLLITVNLTAQIYHYDKEKGSWTEDTLSRYHLPDSARKHNVSIVAGLNYSHFAGPRYYGRSNVGFAVGATDQIKFSENWSLHPTLTWQHKGARNDKEDRNFNTYSIVAESFIAYQIHNVSLMASPYLERVIMASNTSMVGDNFKWSGWKWKFWRRNQAGITAAIQIDVNGSIFQLQYQYGITQVRNELKDWTGYDNYTLWHNHNSVFGARWIVNLKTFSE